MGISKDFIFETFHHFVLFFRKPKRSSTRQGVCGGGVECREPLSSGAPAKWNPTFPATPRLYLSISWAGPSLGSGRPKLNTENLGPGPARPDRRAENIGPCPAHHIESPSGLGPGRFTNSHKIKA
jgi:hypothetical protein